MIVRSFLKRSFLLMFVLVIIMGGNYSLNAQFGFEQLDPLKQNYKWEMIQKWDSEKMDWGDTSSINYITFNNDEKPFESINIQPDSNGIFRKKSKSIINYENDNGMTMNNYPWLADSNKFSGISQNSATYSYTGDNLTGINSTLKPFVGYAAFGAEYAPLVDVIMVMDIGIRFENSKVVCDSVKTKMVNASDDAKALLSIILPKHKFDTSWTGLSRAEYSYNGDNCIAKIYSYNSDSSKYCTSGKDSAVFQNGRILELYSFEKDTNGEFSMSSKDEYTYDGTVLTIITSMYPDGDQWDIYDRTIYSYTPYPGIETRSRNINRKSKDICAAVSGKPGEYELNLKLVKSSIISVSFFDLQGRTTGKIISQKRFPTGLHSIPIRLSPAKYICNINFDNEKMVIPLTIVR